ncbi:EamA-like transporter family protein [Methyloligella halotolerans]|uniref:EamA-like transporter family protein n=1 Tax=Methyloligella halotolerans TaxID=1177755 RepID=A0A1E2RZX5_9HYPH|nr:EamA family transporter [Methyloligella halotolerans]ODA67609.1 EamA-like transporter family protein [Methyloligella halotolerans]
MQTYVLWALLGMLGYSFMTLFVKLAERSGSASTYMVLAVSTTIVSVAAIMVVAGRGELKSLVFELERPPLLWAIAGGLALTVAVFSLFHALSLGPSNIVIPIYGMFIVGGALLGVLVLGEPMPWYRGLGLLAAVIGVVLIAI